MKTEHHAMKIAIFSDCHGNSIALDAVLGEISEIGVDACWVVGDLVALGPDPAGCLQRLMRLENALFVRGNTDRYTLTGDLSASLPAVRDQMPLADVQQVVEMTRSFAWTRGAVTAAGAYDWLAAIPVEQRVTLPDGTRVLIVHAAPGTDDGTGILPEMSDDEIAEILQGTEADLVIVAHTHQPLDRTVNGVRVVNLGCTALPLLAERRSMWTLLQADENGYTVERRLTPYDVAAVIRAIDDSHHPQAEWLKMRYS
jgi:predicted phosphodiesterase